MVGIVLALGGLGGLVAAARDCRRRRDVPSLRYGTRSLEPGRVRTVWLALLIAGYAGGAWGTDVLSRESIRVERRSDAAADRSSRGGGGAARVSIRVPLYRRTASTEPRPAGDGLLRSSRESLVLPWSYLAVLLLYWGLVVRWPAAPVPAPSGSRPGEPAASPDPGG